MPLTAADLRRLTSASNLIFWGGLLLAIDITYTSRDIRLDLFSDAIGAILVAVGARRLREIAVSDEYAKAMRFVFTLSVVTAVVATLMHMPMAAPPVIGAALQVFALIVVIGVAIFCRAMRRLCERALLVQAVHAWSIADRLVLAILVVPAAILALLGSLLALSGEPVHFDSPIVLLIILVQLIPVVAVLTALRRTLVGARRRAFAAPFARCPDCGYDLRGHLGAATRCPECGARVDGEPEPEPRP